MSFHMLTEHAAMVVSKNFEIGNPLGHGTYATVRLVTDRDGREYALKIEPPKVPKSVIRDEARIYKRIQYCATSKFNGCYPEGFAKVFHYDEIPEPTDPEAEDAACAEQKPIAFPKTKILALERLGLSLCHIQSKIKRAFSLPSVLMIGIQLLQRLEMLHGMNIVHRDIKPENILTGLHENKKTLYMCDFGLSRIFRNEYGKHIPDIFEEGFSGLHHFAPLRAHLGMPQSQRDDLESLGYCIIFFAKLRLPWQPRSSEKPLGDAKMGKMKRHISAQDLCADLPQSFCLYMNEVKKLKFMEDPNYEHLRQILRDDLTRLGGEETNFDWLVGQTRES